MLSNFLTKAKGLYYKEEVILISFVQKLCFEEPSIKLDRAATDHTIRDLFVYASLT